MNKELCDRNYRSKSIVKYLLENNLSMDKGIGSKEII
jgi:hypothetical protein